MLERIRSAIAGLLRLGADSLVGPGLTSARADNDAGWNLVSGGDGPADRDWTSIRQDLEDSLEAWRLNAWVRQLVRLTSAYVVGDGIRVSSSRRVVGPFVEAFWSHRQNRIDQRLTAWCDELTRSGELFIALFPNPVDGMQYVRAIPASCILRVETDPEDYEREVAYHEQVPGYIEPKVWPSQHTATASEPCLLHFTVNKPVGATRGESDLTPLLPWARRYAAWLRDRITFNKIRTELATAEIVLDDDSQVESKKSQYRANPPTAGSIFVHGRGEELRFPAANITAFEAKDDGKAIRLAMATAGDVPLHFFSEGESATRATAVEMGDPTHRFYRQRQKDLCSMLVELCETALIRHRAIREVRLPGGDWQIEAQAPDVSRADNEAMATAAKTIVDAFGMMAERGWITDEIAIRLAFKFAGEVLAEEEIQAILKEAKGAREDDGRNNGNGAGGTNGGGNGSLSNLPADPVSKTWYRG